MDRQLRELKRCNWVLAWQLERIAKEARYGASRERLGDLAEHALAQARAIRAGALEVPA